MLWERGAGEGKVFRMADDARQENPWLQAQVDPAQYDAMWEQKAAAGEDIYGEINLLLRLQPTAPQSVLDAGCGTGRIASELARRGVDVVGVDLDPAMIARARSKAPHLAWLVQDLTTLDLGRTFAMVVLLGNVMVYVTPGTEAQIVANLVRHVAPNGVLVAAFRTDRPFSLAQFDALVTAHGLTPGERWATWDRDAWTPQADYVIAVYHQSVEPLATDMCVE